MAVTTRISDHRPAERPLRPAADVCPDDPADGHRRAPARTGAAGLPARADLLRLEAFIDAHGDTIHAITAITATLDSHRRIDIAHPAFWQVGAGRPVRPFTTIAAADVPAGAYRPRDAAAGRARAFVDALAARGRYRLIGLSGTRLGLESGHGLHTALLATIDRWEVRGCARRAPS